MPNPGHEVVDNKSFDGRWAELNKDFVTYLKTLISEEFSPKNLLKKKVFGEDATAQMLYEAIRSFQQILNSPDVPSGRSMYNLFAKNHLDKLLYSLFDGYKKLIEEKAKSVKSVEELNKTHCAIVNDLKKNYDESKKIGNEKLQQNYHKKLMTKIEEFYKTVAQLTALRIEKEELQSNRNEADCAAQMRIAQLEQGMQNLMKSLLEQKERENEILRMQVNRAPTVHVQKELVPVPCSIM
jgi:hypothetical protein